MGSINKMAWTLLDGQVKLHKTVTYRNTAILLCNFCIESECGSTSNVARKCIQDFKQFLPNTKPTHTVHIKFISITMPRSRAHSMKFTTSHKIQQFFMQRMLCFCSFQSGKTCCLINIQQHLLPSYNNIPLFVFDRTSSFLPCPLFHHQVLITTNITK